MNFKPLIWGKRIVRSDRAAQDEAGNGQGQSVVGCPHWRLYIIALHRRQHQQQRASKTCI